MNQHNSSIYPVLPLTFAEPALPVPPFLELIPGQLSLSPPTFPNSTTSYKAFHIELDKEASRLNCDNYYYRQTLPMVRIFPTESDYP